MRGIQPATAGIEQIRFGKGSMPYKCRSNAGLSNPDWSILSGCRNALPLKPNTEPVN